ncbi:rfc-1, partial [Pristionchus pacificus]
IRAPSPSSTLKLMDLRKYFGGGASSSTPKVPPAPKSALSEIKAKAETSKDKKSPRKRSPKAVPTINLDAEDCENHIMTMFHSINPADESPIPSSLKDKKRQRVVVLSDSDDDIPVVKKKSQKKEKTVSPKKSPVKKRSRVITSETPSPVKEKSKNRKKEVTPLSEESEEDEVMELDSEDEFVEKKKPKKKELPKGQKRLTFASQDKKIEPVSSKKASGTAIDPSNFFGGPARSTVEKPKEKEKVREEKNVLSLKNQKVESPKKSKTKTPEKKKKIERDEFSEDSFDDSPKKKSPVKKQTKKREKDEFSEDSSDDSSKKPIIQSKNEKKRDESIPVTKKVKSDPPKETPKIPAPVKNISKSQPSSVQSETKKEEKEVFVPWVDKYKPKSLQQLVGQHGDKSPMRKLMAWLEGWKTWHLGEGAKIKRSKPPPGVPTDGSPFKAILLSGSPGVGKTSCAHLACELAGYKVVEMNASDVRNKKSLDATISQLTGSHQMEEYFGRSAKDSHDDTEVHHVLIMDEVDGMSGNDDRGGLRELVDIINGSKIPIICICNDRGLQKMQTLANHTYDIRFPKPRAEMLLSRVMTICAQEKLKISKEEAMELIEQSGHDVRQTIYNLQMKAIGGNEKNEQKDYTINTFEAARRLLGQSATLVDRQQMFFVDYSIIPLFVQEHYPRMKGSEHSKKGRSELACLRKASDLIAWGDTIEKTIRSGGSWKLLNEQSIMSAVLPTMAMDGQIRQMITFPGWLGKNSNAGKRQRMLRQIEYHANLKISASPSSLITDYLPVLRDKLTRPLIERKNDGVPEVVETMDSYCLVKDDVDAIAELAQWPGTKDPYSLIPPTVKSALTRTLNKSSRALPFVIEEVAKGRKKASNTIDEVEVDEFGNLVEKKNEDDGLEEDDEEEKKEKKVPQKASTSTRGRGGGARGGRGRGG